LLRAAHETCRKHLHSTKGMEVSVCESPGDCPLCGGPWQVQKSRHHHGKSLAYGQFEVWETIHVCAAGCRHPCGAQVTRRARSLAEHLLPGRVVSYDVMVFVGLEALAVEHAISLSTGEISNLAQLFLDALQALHEARTAELRAALAADGGWPLHIDATGEKGRGTLFVALAGWRGWVLGAWKLPTERADAIVPCLREVVGRFGVPCAIMRDLGRAMTRATRELLTEQPLDIPVLGCHLHFLKDVGTDLLDPAHGELRVLFRRLKVRPRLRALARDLGRKLGLEVAGAREAVRVWQNQPPGDRLPRGRAGMAAVRAVAQWVLDYPADSTGEDFPFDRPYLDLYHRCVLGRDAVAVYLRTATEEPKLLRALQRLERILDPVAGDMALRSIVARLKSRCALFDELREALRLVPKPSAQPNATAPPAVPALAQPDAAELQDIRTAVEDLGRSLQARRAHPRLAQDSADGIELILRHIQAHGDFLWGHVVCLPAELGGGIRLVERTNNRLEDLFGDLKHGERRRSGRKVLTQDLENLPPAAVLARNLCQDDYVQILCGSLDRLAQAFAECDRQKRQRELALPAPHKPHSTHSRSSELASASLPRADQRLVRSEAMKKRILSAATCHSSLADSSNSANREMTL
jgi:hypothetical protein